MNSREARRGRGRPQERALRDQHESAFASILADLVARIPGARAAVLVDRDGETVDYAGRRSPYELKVAAAHFRIVLDQVRAQPFLGNARSLVVRASRASFVVHSLPAGYALVVWLSRGAGFRGLVRALPASARRLAGEAGWPPLASPWHAVEVLIDSRRAPRALWAAEREIPVEILGRFRAELPERERAWRVRLFTGPEFTLVREANGFWYMDEHLAD